MSVTATARGAARPQYESSTFLYRITRRIIVIVMHLLYRYKASGQEHVPQTGPTILAVNHIHILDPGAVVTAVQRRIYTLAADKWQDNWLINGFLKIAGTIYVRRGEVDRRALKDCLQVLNKGAVLAVAPEGTRSRGKGLQRAKPGIAYLASRTAATIVPVAFWGVERIGDWKRFKRPSLTVIVGKPFLLPAVGRGESTERLQQLTDQIMVRVGALLPESYRGVYAGAIGEWERDQADDLLPAS
jgi:1-acyl-sn-glycerol-3-phosphate acyltransferase